MSNADELRRNARAAVGDGGSEDWKINPSEHARWFESAAPSLADNLRRARPEGLARMFIESDRGALAARDVFKRTVRRADTAVFFAGMFGALLVVAVGLREMIGEQNAVVIGALGGLGTLASALAAMWVGRARDGELAQRWANERANAEAKRLAYFKDVMEGAKDEPYDKLLAFEYARRFLLDNQIEFFRGRGRQHESAAQTALDRSTYATFLASILTAAGGVMTFIKPEFGVLAGLAAIATALGTLFVSRSEMNLDHKNADRYRAAADALSERRLDIDTYRRRVAQGDLDALLDFYEPVFMALKADHQAFLTDADKRDLAIGAMQSRLDTAQQGLTSRG